jgi:hypothetical protein
MDKSAESPEEVARIQALLDEYVAEKHQGRTMYSERTPGEMFLESPDFKEWMAKRKQRQAPRTTYETKVVTPEKK